MSVSTIIEISDIAIRATQAGNLCYAEPGIALLPAGEEPVLGHAAQKLLRQQPTRIHSRFWADLSTEPIEISNAMVRHGADLVWHQLSELKESAGALPVSLCVPSNISHQQMQLLTGICSSLELQVDYLVNLGLAQLAARDINSPVTHLDLQLHQLVVSNYEIDGQSLKLVSQESLQGISFLKLVDRLLHCLRDKFIQSSRFDPLHTGETEQQLFDQIIAMLETGHIKPFEVITSHKSHNIELTTQDFNQVVDNFAKEILSVLPAGRALAYAPVFSQLPGFKLPEQGLAIRSEDTEPGAITLIQQQDANEGTVFISHLDTGSSTTHVVTETNKPSLANAILFNGEVYGKAHLEKLKDAGFTLDASINADNSMVINGSQAAKIKVNGVEIENGKVLLPKDEIQFEDGSTALAVRIVE